MRALVTSVYKFNVTVITKLNTVRACHIPCEIQSVAIVIIVVVTMAAVDVVAKVSVRTAVIIKMVVVVEVLVIEFSVIEVLADVEIIVVGAIENFVVPTSYSIDAPSDVVVGVFMDALAGVILVNLPKIDIEVLADVNPNTFAVVITVLKFQVSTSLEDFSR